MVEWNNEQGKVGRLLQASQTFHPAVHDSAPAPSPRSSTRVIPHFSQVQSAHSFHKIVYFVCSLVAMLRIVVNLVVKHKGIRQI